MSTVYAPPPGPPPDHLHLTFAPPPGPPPLDRYPLPFLPAYFPLLSPAQTHTLLTQGYATFPIVHRPALYEAASALFDVSRSFFAKPQAEKTQFQIHDGNAQGSEEGWSRVVGEKELLTLRRGGRTCPPAIECKGSTMWQECGTLMQEMIRGVEQSLGMQQGALEGVVVPECTMPEDGANRLETLLRMFRYERRSAEDHGSLAPSDRTSLGGKGRLVAEPHRDLGLLSLVIGASPGLEVLDAAAGGWLPIEQVPYAEPGGLTATLLVGQTLSRLTNNRYVPGRHRVFVPSAASSSTDDDAQFRYSLVFALRPHAQAIISTTTLTTPVTGPFLYPLEGVRARELFAAIARAHWNVNTERDHREVQRSRLQGTGAKGPSSVASEQQDQATNGEARRPADGGPFVSENLTRKKQRWSLSIFSPSLVTPEGESPRRKRWLSLKRPSR